ncbi:MAG TPA: DMT family transporter [Pararhodobacter sp.]|uniref:DMT family transporter n=1 Tax=Pararhodobacter sp. TaxID=2127056 RepID=UPI002BF523BD|nr:DMT family transporter [Pararhodobacter sp.]HPD90846.1 DMT family transporter [Pararhodobacter sp.]
MTLAASPSSTDRVPLGIVLMVAFCAIAPLIDVAAKFASQSVTVTQVTFFRMVVQALLMAPVVAVMRQSLRLSAKSAGLLMARALMLIGSTYAFVGAVQVMPIADALAIVFVEPFILLALGFLLFGDQVGPRRILASVIGFLGALLVIQPNFAIFGAIALYPLATAGFFAVYMLLTRRITRDHPPESMQFHTAWMGMALMVPVLALGHGADLPLLQLSNPPLAVWGQLAGLGLAATVSHIAITYALRYAPSATLAPLHYLEIVNAALFGWLFFGDWPNPMSWAGIVVIVASGLYIIARERHLARAARRQAPPAVRPVR